MIFFVCSLCEQSIGSNVIPSPCSCGCSEFKKVLNKVFLLPFPLGILGQGRKGRACCAWLLLVVATVLLLHLKDVFLIMIALRSSRCVGIDAAVIFIVVIITAAAATAATTNDGDARRRFFALWGSCMSSHEIRRWHVVGGEVILLKVLKEGGQVLIKEQQGRRRLHQGWRHGIIARSRRRRWHNMRCFDVVFGAPRSFLGDGVDDSRVQRSSHSRKTSIL